MYKSFLLFSMLCMASLSYSQNYDSFFTGNTLDVVTSPQGGVCLMGGATEEDEAIKWFLNRADGGDVLVLRASGSDGYNDYFFSQLGVTVNSVETIVFNNASASNEAYIQQKIEQAEAIWFAGGDQWDYISYWRNSAVQNLINSGISQRNIVIGGTSAGMAILGEYYFSAENGTVTSAAALNDPYDSDITHSSVPFLQVPFMQQTITDTHYDSPDRKGRHMVFLARFLEDDSMLAKGIACDEYTAVCIDESGIAHVFGQHPTYDDNAYFLQVNCEILNPSPELCAAGSPIDWNHNGAAVKVYAVKGTLGGTNTFDLTDWQTGSGGEWQNWSISNGVFSESSSSAPNCGNVSLEEHSAESALSIHPNPATDKIEIHVSKEASYTLKVFSNDGKMVAVPTPLLDGNTYDVSTLIAGVYAVRIDFEDGTFVNERLSVIR